MSDTGDGDDDIEKIREQKLEELRQRTPEGDGGDGGATAATDEPIDVEDATHFRELLDEHSPLLVDCYADWCGPCQMMEPVVESLANDSPAAVAKVDIDRLQGLAAELGVQGVPTFLLYVDGEPVERLVGAQDRATFEGLLSSHA